MIQIVKGLNKPYKRIDFVIEGICKIIDGIIDVISFGYISTDFYMWYVDKCLDRWIKFIKSGDDK
jgi:hypothetical protein